MLFSEAIRGVALTAQVGPDVEVVRVDYDSRRVAPAGIFLAMRGEAVDGNRFISAAVERGASAVVTDDSDVFGTLQVTNPSLALGLCGHGRHALAGIAANLLGHPERRLKICGVTGTNGKTTTAFLLEAMLQAAGRKTALVGTIAYHLNGKVLPASHTTPESSDLVALFKEAAEGGATEAIMEVSSHALAQGRVWGIAYDVAIFTNLTRDHLDFHGDMAAYFEAKQQLFLHGGTGVGAPRIAIVNVDDAAGRQLREAMQNSATQVVMYGWSDADFSARDVELSATGTNFTMVTPVGKIAIETHLAGRVNVWNILGAAAAAVARGVSLDQIAAGVRGLASVPGRFEQVACGQPFAVVVDYAHTDDALRNLTRMARELVAPQHGRVITLFGCGGDRDRAKRPLMAKAAAENSDFVVLTSDNPRSEDPAAILRDAEAGLASAAKYAVIEDRAAAIREAIAQARAGDIVLLAGKGHEKTQTTREGVHPFDDVVVAQGVLQGLTAEAPIICN